MLRLTTCALASIIVLFALLPYPLMAQNSPQSIEEGHIYSTTQQAINTYCTRISSRNVAANQQKTCSDAISTLVKGYAQEYAAQFARGGTIASQNENFGLFANYNLNENCLKSGNSLESSLRCIRSIYAIENETGQSGTIANSGQQFNYDRSGVQTAFNQPLFDLISMGTVCAYGHINKAATERQICDENAAQLGLDF